MATVTGFTAERMLDIENSTVVSGTIDGTGHLILTTQGGDDIDAGLTFASVPDASDTTKGIIEIATSAETITGTDATRAVTPAGFLAAFADMFAAAAISGVVNVTSPAIDHVLQFDGTAWVNRQTAHFTGAASSDDAIGGKVTGDSQDRFVLDVDGRMTWGPGSGARDVTVRRSGVGVLLVDGDLDIATAGKGLRVGEGTNAKMGLAVLVAGTVTVNTTAVTANSRIFMTNNVNGGTAGFVRVSARTAGTSFTITSSSGTDTSSIAWMIVEPG